MWDKAETWLEEIFHPEQTPKGSTQAVHALDRVFFGSYDFVYSVHLRMEGSIAVHALLQFEMEDC